MNTYNKTTEKLIQNIERALQVLKLEQYSDNPSKVRRAIKETIQIHIASSSRHEITIILTELLVKGRGGYL